MTSVIHVVAAALVRDDGRVLINQRLPGTPHAGRWEFPGGKLEPDEAPLVGLARELREELGITFEYARPLIRVRHRYPARSVLLDCWRVERWDGEPTPLEGHPLEWVACDELPRWDLLEADRPMVAALRLPPRYAIARDLNAVDALLAAGHTLVQWRAPLTDAPAAVVRCRDAGAALIVNASPDDALRLGADGVHLTSARLRALRDRPMPTGSWVAASCHDADELAHAVAIGCDFAVLGPVAPTASHPDATPIGWERFATLADCAGLPVYAIGGMTGADVETAWRHHGQGVAAIRGFR